MKPMYIYFSKKTESFFCLVNTKAIHTDVFFFINQIVCISYIEDICILFSNWCALNVCKILCIVKQKLIKENTNDEWEHKQMRFVQYMCNVQCFNVEMFIKFHSFLPRPRPTPTNQPTNPISRVFHKKKWKTFCVLKTPLSGASGRGAVLV